MAGCMYDYSIEEFPRLGNETDDSPRILRAIEAAPGEVIYFPKGVYEIASTIKITNGCSLLMHKSAVLKAVKEMDFVVTWKLAKGNDHNVFIIGGVIDGNGLASCLSLERVFHFTLRDITLFNGKKYGLHTPLNCGCELIASNVYCRCLLSGLAGNIGIYAGIGDSHFTDCIVIDYTIGMDIANGSNRLTRCHVWGGPVPPKENETIPEMLVNSISFRITGNDAVLSECYADTGAIGFQIQSDARLSNCTYFSNTVVFPLEYIVVIDHIAGKLSVSQGHFRQLGWAKEDAMIYRGDGENLYWEDCVVDDGDLFLDQEKMVKLNSKI